MNNSRGSQWGIWDLHVHTPDSIVQNYGPRNDATWEKFLTNIEALPPNIRVLGINDYIFLDGYRRILKERERGRLSNIDLVLPVIELRIDKFGGAGGDLSRVNFHAIFSDELNVETIQEQFINALSTHYKLSSQHTGIDWSGVPSRAGLEDLGNKIITSVPASKRKDFGTPLVEGFNNLNLNFEKILNLLEGSYFKGKAITAVGKTEWADIKWNGQSIAEKKTIINSSDLVFTASDSSKSFLGSKEKLKDQNVNAKLLDCSDAHTFSNSPNKDKLGNCSTWIKADSSFQGLKQVLIEFEERTFIGDIPPQLQTISTNKTKYIKSVAIQKTSNAPKTFKESWFNSEIQINTGLVAIIGNKGSGKSALGDIIGLLGNSRQQEDFSFLNSDKFKKLPDNRAKHFEAKLKWESDEIHSKKLDSHSEGVERIKYIPQDYFEKICAQLGEIEETAFDKELKNVIFSHVSKAERLGKKDLDELIRFKSDEINEAIDSAKIRLHKTNQQIIKIESMLRQEHKDNIERQIDIKEKELAAIKKAQPKAVKKPSQKTAQSNDTLKKERKLYDDINKQIDDSKEKLSSLTSNINLINKLERKLNNLETTISDFIESNSELSEDIGIDIEKLVKIKINRSLLDEIKDKAVNDRDAINKLLDQENQNGLYSKLKKSNNTIKSLQETLQGPNKDYEKYLEEHEKWQQQLKEIEGHVKQQGSIIQLRSELADLKKLPDELKTLTEQRIGFARKIFKLIQKNKNVLQELYSPVQKFISENSEIRASIELNFGASIMNIGFAEGLFDYLSLTKAKSFSSNDGKLLLTNIISNHDFNEEDSSISFVEEINNLMHFNKGNKNDSINVHEQLKQGKSIEDLYNFIYSFDFLQARYILKLGDKELKQLSPGERGALLIVFYLLVDLNTIPLIIDQPEHNLDNETVTKLLVPAIKKAKTRRQILIITHNPILAVVCNADQVIVASLDIKDNYRLEYIAGGIENPLINKKIVDILEGTMMSFDNRQRKYIREYLNLLNG
jgi:ABC-type lipoprotein export system ATPase subunit